MPENSLKYLTSKEVKKELKVQDCYLAHIRNSGNLQFTKKGNSYLYLKESIEEFKNKNK
ncbi:helix-turn-helix domain-containing protein [Flavobacterium azooxidireducens]|uniref:Helix-turn-helix domain-containing protein n=1 Tax=Flavobacterium azooxidireducens TaxID=1871076 RepID=A0ABY4KC15_9FLAO|nr:helix-turn-helix domain-containing protein [Flavobacterium azooxidireducens]UPQ78324.1 helix-turn-helix domain-containing protein [Flavobacterium azooxidireducens]